MKKEFKKTGKIKILVYKELDKKNPVFHFRTSSQNLLPLVNILEDFFMYVVLSQKYSYISPY